MNPKNWRKEALLSAIPLMAISIVCLLANGCATTTARTLTADELGTLKKTQRVLIKADGVKGTQKEFFTSFFTYQLTMNAATPVANEEKGQPTSDYDAVITLKCYYFDYGQYRLRPANDLYVPSSAFSMHRGGTVGIGKRIGCRVTITHKQLGQLFDGRIDGITTQQHRLNAVESREALSTTEGYSKYLEEDAQLNFKAALEESQAWDLIKKMRPKD